MTNNLYIYIRIAGFKNYTDFAQAIGKSSSWVSKVINNRIRLDEARRDWIVKKINQYLTEQPYAIKKRVTVQDIFPEEKQI